MQGKPPRQRTQPRRQQRRAARSNGVTVGPGGLVAQSLWKGVAVFGSRSVAGSSRDAASVFVAFMATIVAQTATSIKSSGPGLALLETNFHRTVFLRIIERKYARCRIPRNLGTSQRL